MTYLGEQLVARPILFLNLRDHTARRTCLCRLTSICDMWLISIRDKLIDETVKCKDYVMLNDDYVIPNF